MSNFKGKCNKGNFCGVKKHRKGTVCSRLNQTQNLEDKKDSLLNSSKGTFEKLGSNEIVGSMVMQGGTVRKSYETASWFTEIEFDEQTVELKTSGDRILATVTGHIVEEFFPSGLGGLQTGGGRFTKNTLEETTYHFQWYDFDFAKRVADGSLEVDFSDGIEVYTTLFDHPIMCSGLQVTEACDCENHTNAHGELAGVVEKRGKYESHLKAGYKANANGEQIKETKTHYKIGRRT